MFLIDKSSETKPQTDKKQEARLLTSCILHLKLDSSPF